MIEKIGTILEHFRFDIFSKQRLNQYETGQMVSLAADLARSRDIAYRSIRR